MTRIEAWQQTLCGWGLQSPPALAVSLLQRDVQTRRGEGVAALLRLDQVSDTQEAKIYSGQIRGQNAEQLLETHLCSAAFLPRLDVWGHLLKTFVTFQRQNSNFIKV